MSNVSDRLWRDVLAAVRDRHPQVVRGWFSAIRPLHLEGGVLAIAAANEAQRNYLDTQARQALTEAAQSVTGRLLSVQLSVKPELAEDDPKATRSDSSADATLTLDRFVVDPTNRLAHAAAVAVAEEPGDTYNPLYLHGQSGTGKSHLLQAIRAALTKRSPAVNCLYLPCELFVSQFIEAEERDALSAFRRRCRSPEVLLVDDIQFLRDRERSQEEFFHTFNARLQTRRQVVLSGDRSPNELTGIEPRLLSRFASGLVAETGIPCTESRVTLIRREAADRCLDIAEEAVQQLATSMTTGVRDLVASLDRLEARMPPETAMITGEMVRALLSGPFRTPVPLPAIVEAVADRFDVTPHDLQGHKRARSLTHPRHVSMYLARLLTTKSLEEIGQHFGGRDATTVGRARRTIERLAQGDPVFRALLDEIASEVKNGVY